MSNLMAALNKLCKWRNVFTGWHLGSLPKNAPGVPTMRDLQDFRLIARAELNAITAMLVAKGICTSDELRESLAAEALAFDAKLEAIFPGYRATDDGIEIFDTRLAQETNARLSFPP
jgi:hypothetical protein